MRIPVGEAAATCSPATHEMSGNAFARAHRTFRNLRRGVLTGLSASIYAGSPCVRVMA